MSVNEGSPYYANTLEDSVCFCGGSKPEVAHGINRSIIDADFVVHVRPSRAATHADVANDIATLHVNAGRDGEGGQVAIPGSNAKTVINDHQATVTRMQAGFDHHAIGCSTHAFTIFRGDIDAGMKGAFTTEWIQTLPEVRRYAADHRPQGRAEGHLAQGECRHESRTGIG